VEWLRLHHGLDEGDLAGRRAAGPRRPGREHGGPPFSIPSVSAPVTAATLYLDLTGRRAAPSAGVARLARSRCSVRLEPIEGREGRPPLRHARPPSASFRSRGERGEVEGREISGEEGICPMTERVPLRSTDSAGRAHSGSRANIPF
jgi:hypothetical protein